jgi:hypothetical protein
VVSCQQGGVLRDYEEHKIKKESQGKPSLLKKLFKNNEEQKSLPIGKKNKTVSLNPYEIYRKNKKPEKAWKCWSLKGDEENPYVNGVMSMLSLY